ncbi:non-canonical purine NTP pyrophosphatase [Candidatus Babeliales bacterium]|nr:non-canonical purine NTP pyrophosphatase [Candidatus Babeliales bacterium]
MNTQKEILYATSNHGKFEEVTGYIQENEPNINIVQFSADIPEIQTLDQRYIAIDKAKKAWQIAQRPLLIDDAAIYFDKYNQFPGTLSKFIWQGLNFEGVKKLIENSDLAKFLLYLVYIYGPDKYEVFEGVCEGTLVKPEIFNAHPSLPFDSIFVPNGTKKTYAELRDTPEAKNYLYRLRALQKFLAWYKNKI